MKNNSVKTVKTVSFNSAAALIALTALALLLAGCTGGGENPTLTPTTLPPRPSIQEMSPSPLPNVNTASPEPSPSNGLSSSGEKFVYVATAGVGATVFYEKNGSVASRWRLALGGGYGQAVDAQGNVWIASYTEDVQKVFKLDADGNELCSAHTGVGTKLVAIDANGNAWVTTDDALLEFDSNCVLLATVSEIKPATLAADSKGSVWVTGSSDARDGTAFRVNSEGEVTGAFKPESGCEGTIVFDENGGLWFLGSEGICKYASGSFSQQDFNEVDFKPEVYPEKKGGVYAAFDKTGNLWITGGANPLKPDDSSAYNIVTKIDASGKLVGVYEAGVQPIGVWIDSQGNAWVSDVEGASVIKFNAGTGAKIGEYALGEGTVFVAAGDATGFLLHRFVLKDA